MRLALFLLAMIAIGNACKKEPVEPTMNCPAFQRGMKELNAEAVNREIQKLVADLIPKPIAADSVGHLKNIGKLTMRMNLSCNFSARGICYMCVPGSPPLSEIEVVFSDAKGLVPMYFTLVVNNEKMLEVKDIHF